MPDHLCLRNRQRAHSVDLRLLRRISRALVKELGPRKNFEIGIYLVDAAEIARLNEEFLCHLGPTDVITFNYSPSGQAERLEGEIFICVNEAVTQARRFGTSWPSEVVRYLVHGLLHLLGYDDQTAAAQRIMKREEDRLVLDLERRFDLAELAKGVSSKREV